MPDFSNDPSIQSGGHWVIGPDGKPIPTSTTTGQGPAAFEGDKFHSAFVRPGYSDTPVTRMTGLVGTDPLHEGITTDTFYHKDNGPFVSSRPYTDRINGAATAAFAQMGRAQNAPIYTSDTTSSDNARALQMDAFNRNAQMAAGGGPGLALASAQYTQAMGQAGNQGAAQMGAMHGGYGGARMAGQAVGGLAGAGLAAAGQSGGTLAGAQMQGMQGMAGTSNGMRQGDLATYMSNMKAIQDQQSMRDQMARYFYGMGDQDVGASASMENGINTNNANRFVAYANGQANNSQAEDNIAYQQQQQQNAMIGNGLVAGYTAWRNGQKPGGQ